MFATEAVSGGLPVHIAARILGHKTLTTIQAYLAVFQDDLVRTYRSLLDRRRADRPQEEYREPSEQEWRDFQQHFELRKVSLGTCGRPYGTPCKHEHACIRCPLLQIDPRQRGRVIEIIQNLRERIREARGNGWLGEVEGIQVSLDAATAKLNSLSRARPTADPNWSTSACPSSPTHPPLAHPPQESPRMHPMRLISFGCPHLPTGPGGRPIPPAADRVEGETTGAGGDRRAWSAARNRGCRPDHSVTVRHSASRSTTSRQARCACRGW